jgi:menaquinone-dependent protoporphyrinogen oxidase
MKTLIVYATKYGYAEDCAHALMDQIDGDVLAVDIQKDTLSGVEAFDNIVIGGSVYMGQVNKKLKAFCENNKTAIAVKNTGLFLCCGLPENFEQTMKDAFPAEVIDKAIARECFGGELRTEKMKGPDRIISGMMKKATAGQGKPEVAPNPKNIVNLANEINKKGNKHIEKEKSHIGSSRGHRLDWLGHRREGLAGFTEIQERNRLIGYQECGFIPVGRWDL